MVSCLASSLAAFAQGGGQAPPAKPTETVAPDIPGVVAAGTKIQVIKAGFQGTEGPLALPDGSLIFTETQVNRITKIDKDNNISTFLDVNNTLGEYLLAFDVQPDGSVSGRRDFAKYAGVTQTPTGVTSGADGLAIDNEGRLYAATTAGVQVFSPQGQHLGTIPVSLAPQNIAFAGPDKKTLYMVGRGAAFKLQMLTQGYTGRGK